LFDLDSVIVEVYDLNKAALIPDGGSNTNTCDALNRVVGTFGFTSIVKNNLN